MIFDRDRRSHADALRRQRLSDQGYRLVRGLKIMAASIILGAFAAPYCVLSNAKLLDAATYGIAKSLNWFAEDLPKQPHLKITHRGVERSIPVNQLVELKRFQSAADLAFLKFWRGGLVAFIWWGFFMFAFRGVRAEWREAALRDQVISGTLVVSEEQLAKQAQSSAGDRPLQIGNIPVPQGLETRHFAYVGTTGSGKTTALRQMLDGIEARGDAALVYDTSGEFIAHYYNPSRGDIILNPFDERCSFWSPFDEISHAADADRIAHQLVSETGSYDDDVWLETSRILVANMLRALWREGNCTLDALLEALQSKTKDDLKDWLINSSSARTFADDADRATGSVLFMLSKASNLLQFLRAETEGVNRFSFRGFIHGLDDHRGPKPWIFVPRKEDYFEAAKPLLACWLECAASAVLGLSPSSDRRIWFILDELADLPRVENMARLLPEGRKFGAAVVLTFQALGQMRHRYGPQLAESMLGCCNTKLFLQTIDKETRLWASETIGECEVEIQTLTDALESGEDHRRKTLSKIRKMRPAVLESELRLPKYIGYLLFPDGMPVARIAMTADHLTRRGKASQPAFIAAAEGTTLWVKSVALPPVLSSTDTNETDDDDEGPV